MLRVAVPFLLASSTLSQFCQDTCPPLEGGLPVPSLCPGEDASALLANVEMAVCHPANTPSFKLSDLYPYKGPGNAANIVVISSFYIGCNAGRREANVYSYTSTMIHEAHPNVIFLNSLKGGSSTSDCTRWSNVYERDGVIKMSDIQAKETQPYTIYDSNSVMRDAFFTAPYPHPAYVIIDHKGVLREKFIGPCCGYAQYSQCSEETAMGLNETLYNKILPLLDELQQETGVNADCMLGEWSEWGACDCDQGQRSKQRAVIQAAAGQGQCPSASELILSEACSCPAKPVACLVGAWTAWSECSQLCGEATRYRTRLVTRAQANGGDACPPLLESGACTLGSCQSQCVPALGSTPGVYALDIKGLDQPHDLSFHPLPGRHLGPYHSGQNFSTTGEEVWVVNGGSADVTIITGVGEITQQELSRGDRGWYHYMINVSSIAFNTVGDSGRDPSRDSYGYFATCQDNNNTYAGTKESNFFMGPSLYNSAPDYANLVAQDGSECSKADECYFLHSDMLHESPACAGITHDPETATAYGTVYWAIDGRMNQLVRYDFQQPHGPGLMDHSFAAVRRYPDVPIARGPHGVHMGMVVDHENRALYISNTGRGEILKVHIDTGVYARTAREEYPIFSSRLPSFEYSIYECAQTAVVMADLDVPSGLVLKDSRLYVAEYGSGVVVVIDTATHLELNRHKVSNPGIMGLAFAPTSGGLYAVNALTNQLLEIQPDQACTSPPTPFANPAYAPPPVVDGASGTCVVNPVIPDESLFDQVHVDTGYASDNDAVQGDHAMDAGAALLQNRTDCGFDSDLNFDALLLGGWMCHACLPDNCRDGGRCNAIQWSGYSCDNEIYITYTKAGWELPALSLQLNRTYRFIIEAAGRPVYVASDTAALTESQDMGILKISTSDLAALPRTVVGPDGSTLAEITIENEPVRAMDTEFKWGGMCASVAGNGALAFELSMEPTEIGRIPLGIVDVEIEIDAGDSVDMDLELLDGDGSAVVKWCSEADRATGTGCPACGLLGGASEQTAAHKGMNVTYSGFKGLGSTGKQSIRIQGRVTAALTLRAANRRRDQAPVQAVLRYSYGPADDDCCRGVANACGEAIQVTVLAGEIKMAFTLPAGLSNPRIQIMSDSDVDLVVFDLDNTAFFAEGEALVAYCQPSNVCNYGVLTNATYTTVVRGGLRYQYSGWNTGQETLEVTGITTSRISVGIDGFRAGTATVSYAYTRPLL